MISIQIAPFQLRQFQTSAVQRDIDQAARYIGAGAATVGAAGSGRFRVQRFKISLS